MLYYQALMQDKKMTPEELKEWAHKELEGKFNWEAFFGKNSRAVHQVKSFIDSLIDRTVQATEERMVWEIMQNTLDAWLEAQTLKLNKKRGIIKE